MYSERSCRIPSPDDGRSLIVELTDEGHTRARIAFGEDMRLESAWLSNIAPERRRYLEALLRELSLAVPAYEKRAPP